MFDQAVSARESHAKHKLAERLADRAVQAEDRLATGMRCCRSCSTRRTVRHVAGALRILLPQHSHHGDQVAAGVGALYLGITGDRDSSPDIAVVGAGTEAEVRELMAPCPPQLPKVPVPVGR